MDGQERQSDSPETGGLVPSIFDSPDFFERFVLPVSGSSDSDTSAGAGSEHGLELGVGCEQQRMLRQAAQIAQFLNQRERQLDEYQAQLNAVEAIQADEQRAYRLKLREREAALREREERLDCAQVALDDRAHQLAAWELSLHDEAERLGDSLRTGQRDLELQREAFDRQVRAWEAERRTVSHQDTGSQQNTASHQEITTQQEVAAEPLSVEVDMELRRRRDAAHRGDLREAWESYFTSQREALQSWLGRLESGSSASGFISEATEEGESPAAYSTDGADEVGELGDAAASGESWALALRQVHEHGATLGRLLDELQGVWVSSLEDRLITAEMHEHLCRSCTPDELREMGRMIRERLTRSLGTVDQLLGSYRGEVTAMTRGLAGRLAELRSEERSMVSVVRQQLGQLEQAWRLLDVAQPLAGPHSRLGASGGEETGVKSAAAGDA